MRKVLLAAALSLIMPTLAIAEPSCSDYRAAIQSHDDLPDVIRFGLELGRIFRTMDTARVASGEEALVTDSDSRLRAAAIVYAVCGDYPTMALRRAAALAYVGMAMDAGD